MNTLTIEGKLRAGKGKKATAQLRKEGMVPCNIYNTDGNVYFYAPEKEFKKLVYTSDFNKVVIKTDDGKSYEAIVKEYQFHPVFEDLLHIDFMQLNSDKKIKVTVPVKIEGNAIGVKAGGKLVIKTRNITYKANASDIIDHVSVDVSHLDLGKNIKIKDIKVADGIEILMDKGIPVASVEIPRSLKSAQAAK